MKGETGRLKKDLETIETALGFLLLIIAGTLLSFRTVLRQREALCLTLAGEAQAAAEVGDVYAVRRVASAIFVGSTGYFLCQALSTWQTAQAGGDPVARRSARTNLWAAIFVLVAAVIRLMDLDFLRHCAAPAQEETEDDEPAV